MKHNLVLINYKPEKLPAGFKVFPSSVRKYFADEYQHPLFHNHYTDGKPIYRPRGAPFQFKMINDEIVILALNEGVDFSESFKWPDILKICLSSREICVEFKLQRKIAKDAGYIESVFRCYRNISPYIALNQERHKTYLSLSEDEKRKTVEKGITSHILTSAKWCGVTVNHRIETKLIQMRIGRPVRIKDDLFFVPFDVMFECNTEIPEYMGIGKFVSRGYGTMVRYG